MRQLNPCPFCGAATVNGMINHSSECFIHKLIYFHLVDEIEKAWQMRTPDPMLGELAEVLHKLLAKVALYGYDFQLKSEFEEGKSIMQKYHEQEDNE